MTKYKVGDNVIVQRIGRILGEELFLCVVEGVSPKGFISCRVIPYKGSTHGTSLVFRLNDKGEGVLFNGRILPYSDENMERLDRYCSAIKGRRVIQDLYFGVTRLLNSGDVSPYYLTEEEVAELGKINRRIKELQNTLLERRARDPKRHL